MKRSSLVMLLVFVVFWSASYKSQIQETDAFVEVIDGVECIHNTEIPLHPDKTVAFEEDLSISGEDQDGNIILFEPRLLLVDDNEKIYISESKDQVIKVFDSDGKYIKTIGAKGSGPGEFQMIAYLAITKDGKLIVMDRRARRTSFFDTSGQFLKSFQWQTDYYNFILMRSSSYIISEIVYGTDRQFQELFVKEIDFNGKEIRSYGQFTPEEPKIIRKGNSSHYISLPVSPHSVFAGDQDRGLLFHCLNSKYIIGVYDTSGKLFRKIDLPYSPVPFTNKDAKEYRAIYENSPDEIVREEVKTMKMPKVKNIVSMMYVDDERNLWVRTNESKREEDKILTAFDIFNSDGYYFAKVWIEFIYFIFKKGKMYRMDTDQETGYQTLKRYKVIWKN